MCSCVSECEVSVCVVSCMELLDGIRYGQQLSSGPKWHTHTLTLIFEEVVVHCGVFQVLLYGHRRGMCAAHIKEAALYRILVLCFYSEDIVAALRQYLCHLLSVVYLASVLLWSPSL